MGRVFQTARAAAKVQKLVAPTRPFEPLQRLPDFSGSFRLSKLAQMGALMPTCPRCQSSERQVKAGLNRTGSRRYLCRACCRSYTPEPKPAGYGESVRRQALMLYAGGMSVRAVAKFAGVNHQTVANWVEAAGVPPKEAGAFGAAADTLAAQVTAWRGIMLQEREWRWPSVYRWPKS